MVDKGEGVLNRERVSQEVLDRRILVAANFLQSIDSDMNRYGINEKGKIVESLGATDQIKGDLYYSEAYKELVERFDAGNKESARQFASEKGVVDTMVINGCVVVVYDSSKYLPTGINKDAARGDFSGPTDFLAKGEDGKTRKMYRLGLVTVDINPAKRTDGVDSSISLRHELSHHSLSVADALLSEDPQLEMKSGYRAGRKSALYGDARDRLTTDAAYGTDMDKYAVLLGRDVAKISQSDIEAQLFYLDEWHASALQRKDNWFSALENVYNNHGANGKHWEVVGGHPADAGATRELLKLMQAIYLSEVVVGGFTKQTQIGEGQKYLINQVPELMRRACAIIGTARTVKQAERLVEAEWNRFIDSDLGRKLATSPRFTEWRKQIYSTGWQVEGLEEKFIRPGR